VVGAFAVAFHGFPRYTANLDLLGRPTEENANRILLSLSEFGFGNMGIQAARREAELDGIRAHFIGRAELLRNKEQTGRAKDLGDAEELRKRNTGRDD
jgi:hypothetical protein